MQSVVKKNMRHVLADDLSACERMSAVLDEAARLAAPALVRMLREERFSAEEAFRRAFRATASIASWETSTAVTSEAPARAQARAKPP